MQNTISAQIVMKLWNEDLKLQKEKVTWKEKTTKTILKTKNKKADYVFSKESIDKNGKKTTLFFKEDGTLKGKNFTYSPDDSTEIFETTEGDKEVQKFNENGFLTSKKWTYPDGSKDEELFHYQDNNLVEIVNKDMFETVSEKLYYQNNKLVKIESLDEEKNVVMQQKFIYKNNILVEKQRIQNNIINKRVYYNYNENGQLISKTEDKINRFSEEKMPPEEYIYTYHDNKKLKEAKWIIYTDIQKSGIKYESSELYNENGLLIKEESNDYKSDIEENTTYIYTYKF